MLGLASGDAGSDESADRGLIGRRRRHLGAGVEIGQMGRNNRVRIVIEQLRGPQLGVEILTLGLQLGRQTAVEYDRTAAKSLGERGDHQPNVASPAHAAAQVAAAQVAQPCKPGRNLRSARLRTGRWDS